MSGTEATASHDLRRFKRLVIKIGSALLVDRKTGRLNRTWLESLADDVERLAEGGAEIVIVSSGAIALGRGVLGLPAGALRLEESQAAAAVGQIALARSYTEILGARSMLSGQILLTLADTEERRRYLNARSTMATLLKLKAIPVVNENDTVATNEIRYGDNDRLAARVATMVSAECLVLLSDIDGLYDAPPFDHPDARHIPLVKRITPEIEAMAGAAGSELSRGGMKTKIDAGRIATAAGTAMVIASGKRLHPLQAIQDGARCTWFLPDGNPVAARKRWISGALDMAGTLVIDAGAGGALQRGKSLLAAGIRGVEGGFCRGDAVLIRLQDGTPLGRGIVAYDAEDVRVIAGKKSEEIEALLGYAGRKAVIHRDDMVLHGTSEDAAMPDAENTE